MRKDDFDFTRDAPGVRGKDQNTVAHEDRFLDVVGDQKHRSDRQAALNPEIEKIGADRLRGQDVERGKLKVMFQAWLVKMAKIAAASAPATRPGNSDMKNTTVKEM
jgi:hypothetical protein